MRLTRKEVLQALSARTWRSIPVVYERVKKEKLKRRVNGHRFLTEDEDAGLYVDVAVELDELQKIDAIRRRETVKSQEGDGRRITIPEFALRHRS